MNSEQLAKKIRKKVIELSYKAQTAHLGSSLSCVDIISVIFHSYLNITKNYLLNSYRDRFILSKGHAATTLYSAMFYKNIISKSKLQSYCKVGSELEEHPSIKLKGVEVATGSLGHGLAVGCGIAQGLKIKKKKSKVFVLLSDGECNEGSVWESFLYAYKNNLNNLIAFIDYNKWQATGKSDEVLSLPSLDKKIKAFNWKCLNINGHNHKQIEFAILKACKSNRPTMIICNTVKGKGIHFMENDNNWHYKSPSKKEYLEAMKILK